MGACLISMVARLTIGKKGYEAVEVQMRDILRRSDQLYQQLTVQVDEDAAAFNEVIAAMKLPKANETEAGIRTEAMQKSFRRAAEVPYKAAVNCKEVLDLAAEIASGCNTNVSSDVGVAAELAWAGLQSSLLNVKINLPYLKDEEYVLSMRRQLAFLIESAGTSKEKALNVVSLQIQ
jgi:formiminotetrahydrofolate cyclodeaminase